jgi:hypothetical protein
MSQTTSLPELGSTYQHFVTFVRGDAPTPLLSPERFIQALRIDTQTLATQAHVHRNTVSRAPASRGVQDYLRESLRVIKAATDLNGDVSTALFWYRNEPLREFGYKTAETLVSDGRADDLLRFLASLDAGAAG